MNLTPGTQDADCSTPFVQSRIEASLNSESFEVPDGLSALEIQNFIISKAQIANESVNTRGVQ